MAPPQDNRVEQLVGVPPAWFVLGDPVEIDGVKVRPVLGDFSDRGPYDQPPKYVADTLEANVPKAGFDRSPTRPAVRQAFPGRSLGELQGIASGRVALLFNGPSLAQHDLWALKRAGIPIIGMNRTHLGWKGYSGPQPDWLCLVDHLWFDHPKMKSALTHPQIINGSTHTAPVGWRAIRHPRMTPFSFDLVRDGYVGPVPCTTGYLALQLAVWMGYTDLYCLGLDMGGGHFDGTKASLYYPSARTHLRRIAKKLAEERPDVRIRVCGSPLSQADAFEKCSYADLVGPAEAVA